MHHLHLTEPERGDSGKKRLPSTLAHLLCRKEELLELELELGRLARDHRRSARSAWTSTAALYSTQPALQLAMPDGPSFARMDGESAAPVATMAVKNYQVQARLARTPPCGRPARYAARATTLSLLLPLLLLLPLIALAELR